MSLPGQIAELMLEMPQQRSCAALHELIVRRLTQRPDVALARLWLVRPGDICDVCYLAPECPDRAQCMHLVASAGKPTGDPAADWSSTEGSFRRFPIGVRKVGTIAATKAPVEVVDVRDDDSWIVRPGWARAEQIRGFAGQPLLYRGDVLGVLAVFTRVPLDPDIQLGLRLVADHAAIAISNARAFEEIERLRARLEVENEFLRQEVREAARFGEIVGQSPALRRAVEQVDLVASTPATVLITGESGTGKELVAWEVHSRSARRDRPLIKVNCASVPRELYESEFFGHVKGAFTGAVKDRAGRFDAADGGTLFLDEIGEIPLELQAKLLRVLQEGQYERVGEERTRTVDVRLVAATNRDLQAEVAAGRFREDLYYRLNVFPIHVPPLRERREDVPLLVAHFLERAARRLGREVPRVTRAVMERLARYPWPGNVRELQNVVERALITTAGGTLRVELPGHAAGAVGRRLPDAGDEASGVRTEAEMRRLERDNLLAALAATGWRVAGDGGAAELLGVKPTTLASRIKKLGLRRESSG